MMRIAVENSTWNNIGDAFYQLPIQQMLTDTFVDAEIVSFDGPINRAFRPRRFEHNAFDSRSWTEADHYVLSGPILGSKFLTEYGPFIRSIVDGGKSYSVLSAHSAASGDMLRDIVAFLSSYPPRALHTRDHPTFDRLKDIARVSLDGNCFAFFVSYLRGRPTLKAPDPYLCVSFHSMREPLISVRADNDAEGCDVSRLTIDHKPSRNRLWRLARQADFLRAYPKRLSGWRIIRPVHGFYPFPHLIFARPDSYISYNPLNFLAIYEACDAVVTDRVHAGVATLSFGKHALVVGLDERYALFDAGPVERCGNVLALRRDRLETSYREHLEWLRTDFAQALA